MEVFSVLWHSLENEKKYSVGVLVYNQNWHFKYNQGLIREAIEQGFRPFPDMPDIKKEYISDFLFPTFQNRYLERDNIKVMKNQLGQLVTDKILIKHIK